MAYVARDIQTVISWLKFAYCAGTHKALKIILHVGKSYQIYLLF